MSVAVLLAIVVFLLGAVVLFVKLRPPAASSSLAGSFLESAREAVADTPEDPWAHVGLGVALFRAEDIRGAQSEFEKALSLDDKNWQANLQLASLIKASDPDRAVKLLGIAAKNAPTPETPYLLLGNIQFQEGQYREALAAYLQSIAAEPALYDSRLGLGRTYEALGQKKLALEQYKQALRLIPGDQAAKDGIERLTDGSTNPTPPPASPAA
jgi:tetratricopeptide (TPR) repeat protein